MTIDPEYFDEVSRTAAAALQTFGELGPSLAAREVEERSPDGRIIVRVTAGGTISSITLRDGVLRRYDSAALGELVAKTLNAAQRRARADYENALMAAIPDEVAEVNRMIRDSARGTS